MTVAQVARVADAFTEAGIMVHAYLMYGFPTQTDQETIDALEMVRQLFEQGVVQSGFWHRFAMTAHSPVGLNPEVYQVAKVGPDFDGFAENDLIHDDPTGADHDQYGEGLRKSLFNYMHGVCFDFDLSEWFDFETPITKVTADYIQDALEETDERQFRKNAFVFWLGNFPEITELEDSDQVELWFFNKQQEWGFLTSFDIAQWLSEVLNKIQTSEKPYLLQELIATFEEAGLGSFDDFQKEEIWGLMREHGLLIL